MKRSKKKTKISRSKKNTVTTKLANVEEVIIQQIGDAIKDSMRSSAPKVFGQPKTIPLEIKETVTGKDPKSAVIASAQRISLWEDMNKKDHVIMGRKRLITINSRKCRALNRSCTKYEIGICLTARLETEGRK